MPSISMRAIKAFQDRPVEREKLDSVLEAAKYTPMPGSKTFLIEDRDKIEEIKGTSRQEFLSNAPAVFVFCVRAEKIGKEDSEIGPLRIIHGRSAISAAVNARCAASRLDLGCDVVTEFNPNELQKAIGASDELFPVIMMPVGYIVEKPERKPKLLREPAIGRDSYLRFG